MSIAITEAHLELESVARSFLAAQKARAAARSLLDATEEPLPPFWSDLAELGWLGLHVAEEYGGSGYGLEELVVVVEALGHAVAPGPFLPTVIASALIADVGSEAQRARFLPGLTDGTIRAALGVGESLRLADDGSLSGDGGVVLGGGLGELVVVAAGDDMVIVERSQPGVTVSTPPNLDPTRRSGRVRFEGVRVDEIAVLRNARPRALALTRTLGAAEACGGAHQCVEMATAYAKVREQFGRVIGTFQAVKHHCANMLVAAELATAATWDAARAARGNTQQFELASAIAAVEALPAFLQNARLNIQVHGGIGFTWEHDAHLLLRRAASLVALLGDGPPEDVARLISLGVNRELAIDLPPEAEETRREVRSFAAGLESLPAPERLGCLIDAGYLQPHWPRPWGREARAVEQLVIDEELAAAGIQRPDYGVAPWLLLAIVHHGTPDQIERWVRPTLLGDLVWCQLFSEPSAGSDAAAIRTKGTKVEGGWIVSGQKVWTSYAHDADFGLATVRTDPDTPKHAGITMMVVDMQASGVEVRPLREATGKAVFNEVFFDDVFIPDDDVIGAVDGGWKVARSVFGNERLSIGDRFGELTPVAPIDLVDLFRRHNRSAGAAEQDLGRLLAEAHTLRLLNLRRVERAVAGGEPGPEANVTKLVRSEHEQRVAMLALELDAADVILAEGEGAHIAEALIFNCALTIGGGTSEITRNQIGERILGLPRDPLMS